MISTDHLLQTLSLHIGQANGIHVKALVMEITGNTNSEAHEERVVRELISNLRMQGHHICGTPSAGYFIAQTEEELNDTCKFLFNRAMTSLEQVARMKKVSLPDLSGQLGLDL